MAHDDAQPTRARMQPATSATAISDGMVALLKAYYGRGPEQAEDLH